MDSLLEEKKNLLCRAIGKRFLVQFKYDGRMRIVEPFCFGVSTADNYVLRGFQIRGADKTKPLCWRLYYLAEMSQLNITQHNFTGNRPEYEPQDPLMTDIICQIP